jgi:F0F1-type ATP synthase membrane subunit b/b'
MAKTWIKAHWNWLVLVGLFCLAYLLGKKNARGLLIQAEVAKAQYKGEVEAMKKATEAKENRDEKIENRTEEIKKRIEEKKKQDLEDLKRDINADQVFKDLGIDKKG